MEFLRECSNKKEESDFDRKKRSENGFEEWGNYMNAKKAKLEKQYACEAEKRDLISDVFRGISIFVNGYTVPSADQLKIIMMDHGGIYHHYYKNGETTYMIASNLPAAKIKKYQSSKMKIIKPEWVLDSIKAGKPLEYASYSLLPRDQAHSSILKFTTCSRSNDGIYGADESCNVANETCAVAETHHEGTDDKSEAGLAKKESDNFLEEFYQNSRLHFLSTMGWTYKQLINDKRAARLAHFPGISRLKKWLQTNCFNLQKDTSTSFIMHVDMDCFFASVAVKLRPELSGQPVAVTHTKGAKVRRGEGVDRAAEFQIYRRRRLERSGNLEKNVAAAAADSWFDDIDEADSMAEVACCNYKAREAGVKNGMLLGQALKLCPTLKTAPYDFQAYKDVSRALYECIAGFTLDIEAVSCDEMYVDCRSILEQAECGPLHFASFLRKEIKEITGCACSTGFGPNKLLARLATKRAKPDGQFCVGEEERKKFMQEFPLADLPGVGRRTAEELSALHLQTCQQLQQYSLDGLKAKFGDKMGATLHDKSFGKDDSPLVFYHERKSVSAEMNYGIRFSGLEDAHDFLRKLSQEVANRLEAAGKAKSRQVTLKLMVRAKGAPLESSKYLGHGACDNFTKSVTLPQATSDYRAIFRATTDIFKKSSFDPKDLRGVGIQMTKLEWNSNKNGKVASLDDWLLKGAQRPKANSKTALGLKVESSNTSNVRGNEKLTIGCFSVRNNSVEVDGLQFAKDYPPFEVNATPSTSTGFGFPCGSIGDSKTGEASSSSSGLIGSYYKNVSLSQVDPEFLKALPPDVRGELMTFMESKEYLATDPNGKAKRKYIVPGTPPSLSNTIPFKTMKKAIRDWIDKCPVPNCCDIKLLSDYIKGSGRNTSSPLCLFLKRAIESKNSDVWSTAYNKIITNEGGGYQ